jgi:hypothetical protein
MGKYALLAAIQAGIDSIAFSYLIFKVIISM